MLLKIHRTIGVNLVIYLMACQRESNLTDKLGFVIKY